MLCCLTYHAKTNLAVGPGRIHRHCCELLCSRLSVDTVCIGPESHQCRGEQHSRKLVRTLVCSHGICYAPAPLNPIAHCMLEVPRKNLIRVRGYPLSGIFGPCVCLLAGACGAWRLLARRRHRHHRRQLGKWSALATATPCKYTDTQNSSPDTPNTNQTPKIQARIPKIQVQTSKIQVQTSQIQVQTPQTQVQIPNAKCER